MFFEGDSDDEFGGDVGFTFNELERREAQKSVSALIEIDTKLYQDVDPVILKIDDKECDDPYRRYESHGYEANYDVVENKEILQWRRAFPYLQIEGKKITTPFIEQYDIPLKNNPVTVNMDNYIEDWDSLQSKDNACNFSVVGKAIQPVMLSKSDQEFIDEEEGEYLARDGVLEEFLDVDCGPVDEMHVESDQRVWENKDGFCATPGATQREEVINLLFATIWPDVVQALGPVLQKVIEIAKEHPELIDEARHRMEERKLKATNKPENHNDFAFAFDQDSKGSFSGCESDGDC